MRKETRLELLSTEIQGEIGEGERKGVRTSRNALEIGSKSVDIETLQVTWETG